MIRWTAIVLVALAATSATRSPAAEHPPESHRRIVNRVPPDYPAIARTLGLSGVVKVEAVVGNDGNPKTVDVKGGHPVLVQATINAVHHWRWEASPRETRELIEVTFAPNSQ